MKFKLYILLLISTSLFAQKVATSIDTTRNVIGAQFTLTLKTNVKTTATVTFPKATNFGALEVIESYAIDTIKENDRMQLIKKYGLIQFDSGKYVIPRIPVLINRIPVFSDSLLVEVNSIKVDTLKQKMFDIKPIIQVKKPMGNWWKYVLGFLLIAGLIALAYFLYKKYRKQPTKEIVYNSPIEKATSLLQLLEKKELLQKGEIKEYYSELTDIARDYIEEAIEIPAKESTTSELIVALRIASTKKKMKLSKDILVSLEKVLKQADLVKFAKVKPLDFEIAGDREKIENAIITLDKSIPVVIDENSKKWEMLQEQIRIKKQKRNKIFGIAAISVVTIFSILMFFILTKGLDYVKNGFIGYSTTELLEGEWVKSEYGDPSILINAPQVLKRIDTEKKLPKGTMALFKDMQMFEYGSLMGRFYISVSSAKFKKETEINLSDALTGVVFSQAGGLQQIMVAHKEGDQNAEKIAEKMLNSIELQTTN